MRIIGVKFRQHFVLLPKFCTFAVVFTEVNMDSANMILEYANRHHQFTLTDMYADLREQWQVTKSAMAVQIGTLVGAGLLARIAHGVYSLNDRQPFRLQLSAQATAIGKLLNKQFPLITFCLYESSHISPLQHHLAFTNTLYVELERSGTETAFHFLKEKQKQVFLMPSETDLMHYLDTTKRNIFVKPLVSEAPLCGKGNLRTPSIEKLLVDIYCDKDFYFLQGAEYNHIWQNALDTYIINTNTLLRYAARRGVREELNTMLQNDK